MELASFRPIRFTSCVKNLFEKKKYYNQRLQWWLQTTKSLPDELAGFRSKRYTMNCILDLVILVQHERKLRKITVAVFLDIKRAYDTVSHVTLYTAF